MRYKRIDKFAFSIMFKLIKMKIIENEAKLLKELTRSSDLTIWEKILIYKYKY